LESGQFLEAFSDPGTTGMEGEAIDQPQMEQARQAAAGIAVKTLDLGAKPRNFSSKGIAT
jgi:hypothetical protein